MQKLIVCVGLSLMLLFAGCARKTIQMYPVTDGFQKALPQPNTRIVLWGEHPAAVGMATTWLQKRGLTVVERARLKQILDEQSIRLTHTSDDEAQVLKVGKLLGAEMVVFVDTPFTTGTIGGFGFNQYGGSGLSSTVYSSSVSIRGVNIETGEVVWTGNARYPQSKANLDDSLVKLTCQALATAWGFRPSGQHEIKSEAMCSPEEKDVLSK